MNYSIPTTNITSLPNLDNSNPEVDFTTKISDLFLITEHKTFSGKPIAGKVSLDYIFDLIIKDAVEAKIPLKINRKTIIKSDFKALENADIIDNFFNEIDDKIMYEFLAGYQVNDKNDLYDLIDEIIVNLSDTTERLGFDINDLCITKKSLKKIEIYINQYVNKLYRNILQLIRVRKDWRLYGPGALLIGDYLKTSDNISKHTTIPSECFKNYQSAYVAGSKIYGDETDLSETVQYSDIEISPNNIFTASEHTHTINFSVSGTNIPEFTIGPWTPSTDLENIKANLVRYGGKVVEGVYYGGHSTWEKLVDDDHSLGNSGGKNANAEANAVIEVRVSYGSGTKYLSSFGSASSKNILGLPAYSTYIWQWLSEDPTFFQNVEITASDIDFEPDDLDNDDDFKYPEIPDDEEENGVGD